MRCRCSSDFAPYTHPVTGRDLDASPTSLTLLHLRRRACALVGTLVHSSAHLRVCFRRCTSALTSTLMHCSEHSCACFCQRTGALVNTLMHLLAQPRARFLRTLVHSSAHSCTCWYTHALEGALMHSSAFSGTLVHLLSSARLCTRRHSRALVSKLMHLSAPLCTRLRRRTCALVGTLCAIAFVGTLVYSSALSRTRWHTRALRALNMCMHNRCAHAAGSSATPRHAAPH